MTEYEWRLFFVFMRLALEEKHPTRRDRRDAVLARAKDEDATDVLDEFVCLFSERNGPA